MKLPSVTTVLSPFSDFSKIRPEVLQRAANRGSRVHAACAIYAKGLWADCALYPGDGPFFDSFMKWSDMAAPEFVSVEEAFADPLLGYMGHPDAVVYIPGDQGLTIVDYKTPMSISRTWHPQIAAYAHLARKYGYDVRRGLAVRLRRNGGLAIATEIDIDGEPWAAFLNALGAYRYFKEGGR
jgi:hypothetical protein